jgi:peptide/nickel transport system ATP-binding protein
MSDAILSLQGVSKRFARRPSWGERIAAALGAAARPAVVHAVDRVDLDVAEGEVLGLVGESGCGKSTLGRIAAGILLANAGNAMFRGQPIALANGLAVRKLTTAVQTVFQDPFASLNPRQQVGAIVAEGPLVHGLIDRGAARAYVADLFRRVGLDADFAGRYPHQFSGGQRQRIAIARALAMRPAFLVCDEAVASLDVSIQAQVLNLFMSLRRELGLTYLFISHDLGVVRHISDRVAIMYLGRIVELASTAALFDAPSHPYTQALLAAVPRLDQRRRRFVPVSGEVPSASNPPAGCHFHPRCPYATDRCRGEVPALREIAPGRFSACHLNG